MKATPKQLREFCRDPFIAELLRQIPPRTVRGVIEPGLRVIGIEFADGAVFRERPPPVQERPREADLQAAATWLGVGPYPKALRSDDYDKRTGKWRKVEKKKKKQP